MKIHIILVVCLVGAPVVGHAQILLDALKDGTSKAVQAVGETAKGTVEAAGKATGAVKETIGSTQESLADEATPAATRAKLDAMTEATLARLFAEKPGSRDLFQRSVGYAVFDKREASFYVVAGYGRGVAVDAANGSRVYMKMATTGAGLSFGLGGFASQVVILFENPVAFQTFVTEGLDATGEVAAMAGDNTEQLALRFDNGKAVFVLTGKGWKVAAKLTGSRYWADDVLNADR